MYSLPETERETERGVRHGEIVGGIHLNVMHTDRVGFLHTLHAFMHRYTIFFFNFSHTLFQTSCIIEFATAQLLFLVRTMSFLMRGR